MADRALRVCDINNFFSATGGGVRRYHLEKLRRLAEESDVEYHVIVPSDREQTEDYNGATIHHLPATEILGSGYRFLLNPFRLRNLLKQIRPDVIEVGSPYVLPDIVRLASRGLGCRLVGFWHAHYPIAYFSRPLRRTSGLLAKLGERFGWWWARRTYGRFSATMAAANCLLDTLRDRGVEQVRYTPLGVDLEMFSPRHRDDALRSSWNAGPDDVVMGFPHRFCEEKNLSPLIAAYENIRANTEHKPHLVFAGTGPALDRVQELVARYPEVHYTGYLERRQDVAAMIASCDVVAALSPTETFGLSAAEAMASGTALIGSDELSVGEMLRDSRCGIGVSDRDSDAIATAWIELLKPGRARLLGARGRAFAAAHFNWQRTFERILSVYRNVVTETGEPLPSRPALPAPRLVPAATDGWGASIARLIEDDITASRPTPVPAVARIQPSRRRTARLALGALSVAGSAGASGKTGVVGRSA